MRILLIKFRHIGDVLLSSALIRNLKLLYPDSSIDMAVNDHSQAILENNPDIEQIFAYPRKEISKVNLFKRFSMEAKYLYELLKNDYDLVINLTEGDRGAIYSLLSRAKVRLGIRSRNSIIAKLPIYTKEFKEPLSDLHAVERDLNFLTLLDKSPVEKKIYMYHSKSDEQKIASLLEEKGVHNFILVHPVSRWMFKCWDDKKFAKVIDTIQEEFRIDVILTASPDKKEVQRVENILTYCKTAPVDLSGKLSLKELSALIKRARIFVGVDTAPMHIAAAHNVPTICPLWRLQSKNVGALGK